MCQRQMFTFMHCITMPNKDRFDLKPTTVVGQQEHLKQAQRASCEVQQNVADAPAKRALALEVHPCLKPTARGMCSKQSVHTISTLAMGGSWNPTAHAKTTARV